MGQELKLQFKIYDLLGISMPGKKSKTCSRIRINLNLFFEKYNTFGEVQYSTKRIVFKKECQGAY